MKMMIRRNVILLGSRYLHHKIHCNYSFHVQKCSIIRSTTNIRRLKDSSYTCMKVLVSQFHSSKIRLKEKDLRPTNAEIALRVNHFQEIPVKNKDTFLKVIDAYNKHDKIKRGHIEFIYAALKFMEDFGILADLEAYKKLMDVFPKGKMIPKNLIQAEFFHFPRHQECALVLMDQMEYRGVCPDKEMGEIIKASFGRSSHVFKKYARMLYWMPKLKNINPYVLPDPLPSDIRELAKLALRKMSVDTRTKITEYDAEKLEDSNDKTWVMSAQSPAQQKLIQEHSEEKALYVEGPYLIWLKKISMTYFILRADPKIYPEIEIDDDDVSNLSLYMFGEPKPVELTLRPSSVHEQEEGIIMSMCCTGTSSKDSLLSWIRFLHDTNPKLDNIPVLFKLRSSPGSLVAVNASAQTDSDTVEENRTETQNVQS